MRLSWPLRFITWISNVSECTKKPIYYQISEKNISSAGARTHKMRQKVSLGLIKFFWAWEKCLDSLNRLYLVQNLLNLQIDIRNLIQKWFYLNIPLEEFWHEMLKEENIWGALLFCLGNPYIFDCFFIFSLTLFSCYCHSLSGHRFFSHDKKWEQLHNVLKSSFKQYSYLHFNIPYFLKVRGH